MGRISWLVMPVCVAAGIGLLVAVVPMAWWGVDWRDAASRGCAAAAMAFGGAFGQAWRDRRLVLKRGE